MVRQSSGKWKNSDLAFFVLSSRQNTEIEARFTWFMAWIAGMVHGHRSVMGREREIDFLYKFRVVYSNKVIDHFPQKLMLIQPDSFHMEHMQS